ncbi:stage III sporulation protein AE [Effusibacillus lacus]|uniref:Stage III sporulation protein AE n=1 Tax=Effusibacillus lacus TaxID=1348429 RepID=A0A292YQX9_9BACL|nr:stage III sporulation protein AE [Effusibacillus lacus]TCS72532.1 stage III sporulation protein AE [Effusibacillus lacus]GAX90905.1 stage III sporulation protein AE [Effusibacillus lacus]
MNRWRIGILAILLMYLSLTSVALAVENPSSSPVNSLEPSIDTSEVDKFLQDLIRQYGDFLPSVSSPHILDLLRGDGFTVQGVLLGMLKFLFFEIMHNSLLLGSILILAVLAALLENLQNAFERNTVSQVGFAVIYIALIILSVNSFMTATGYAKQAIEAMSSFMMGSIPLLLTLMASSGAVTSAGLLYPTVVFVVNAFAGLVTTVVFPLIFFSAILLMVSEFSSRYKLSQLGGFLRTTGNWLLGAFFVIFIGIMTVKGAMGGVADGIALRTAKFATSTLIPVVGKMFSDSIDTVVGASMLVKNSVGVGGLLILALLCTFPALKIISLGIVYSLSGALMQPLGNSPVVSCLSTIGKTLFIIFSAMATVGFMFFLSVTMILLAGNIQLMVR